MTEDWSAVARAINERVTELGLRQRELADNAGVSQAIVREIQRETVQRRRSARTLQALSLALGWNQHHLTNVLAGRDPDGPPPVSATRHPDDVPVRLGAIEDQLRVMSKQLEEINARLGTLAGDEDGPPR